MKAESTSMYDLTTSSGRTYVKHISVTHIITKTTVVRILRSKSRVLANSILLRFVFWRRDSQRCKTSGGTWLAAVGRVSFYLVQTYRVKLQSFSAERRRRPATLSCNHAVGPFTGSCYFCDRRRRNPPFSVSLVPPPSGFHSPVDMSFLKYLFSRWFLSLPVLRSSGYRQDTSIETSMEVFQKQIF